MNTLVAGYRKIFPEDDRSDEAITLDLGDKYPDKLANFPDALADFQRLRTDEAPTSSAAGATGRSFLRSVLPTGAAAVGGMALPAAALALAPETGGLSLLGLGFLGAGAAGLAGGKAEQVIESHLPEPAQRQLQSDAELHPVASEVGNLLAGLPFFEASPGRTVKGAWAIAKMLAGKGVSEAEQKAAQGAAIQLGLGTAQGVAMPLVFEGRAPTGKDALLAAIQAAIFHSPRGFLPFSGHTAGQKVGEQPGVKNPIDAQTEGAQTPESSGAMAGAESPLTPGASPLPGVATASELMGRPGPQEEAIRAVIARELSGERSQSLQEAINAIYAGGDVGFYNVEKRRMAAELAAENTAKGTENAIQEPAADESLLRQEGPEVGLSGVGEGNARPEELAQAAEQPPVLQPPKEEVRPAYDRLDAEKKARVDSALQVVKEAYRAKSAIAIEDIEEALALKEPVKPAVPNATVAPEPSKTELQAELDAALGQEATPVPAAAKAGGQSAVQAPVHPPVTKAISPGELVNLIDFEGAKVVGEGQKSGKGQKNAEAFTETNDPAELYKDKGASRGNKNLSRKLGVFTNGNLVLIGTASENVGGVNAEGKRPLRREVATHNGRATYDDLTAAGFKLVASLKTKEPTNGFAVTYSAAEWGEARGQLLSLRAGARSTAAAVESHLTGVVGPTEVAESTHELAHEQETEPELPAKTKPRPGGLEVPTDAEIAAKSKLTEVKAFGTEQAETLHDEFGGGKIEKADAVDLVLGLLDEKADKPRLAVLSLLGELERNYGIKDKEELIEAAAERLAGVSAEGRAKPDFARGLVEASQGPVRPATQPAHHPGAANVERTGGPGTAGQKPGGGTAEVIRYRDEDIGPRIIGNVDSGQVKAVVLSDEQASMHGGRGVSGRQRWRYDPYQNRVQWTDTPTDESKVAVENWLSRRGIQPDAHVNFMAEDERFRPASAAADRGRYSTEAYHSALDGLAAAGLNVTVLGEKAGALVREYGSYDNARRLVTLSVSDLMRPTVENFKTLAHEAFHALFANETPERQAMGWRAIEGALVPGYKPRLAEGLTGEQRAQVTAEEHLAETMAQKLAAEGWRADEAKGAVQGIIRLLKDLWNRAAIWIQQARFGEDHVDPQLAQRYFENRLQSLLAGDVQMSFLNFIGGRRLTFAEQVGDFTAVDGSGMPTGRYNFETGAIEHPEPLPSSLNAVRYRAPEFSNDPESTLSNDLDSNALAHRDVAAQNNLEDGARAMYDQWTALGHNTAGLSFEDFVQSGNFVGLDELPAEFITRRNEELSKLGQAPVNPRTKIADIPSPSMQQRAATVAQGIWYQLRTALDTRRASEEWNLTAGNRDNLVDKLARANQRLSKIQNRADNAEFLRDDAKQEIEGLWKEFRDDAKDIKGTARKAGAVTQTIRALESRIDQPLLKQYATAINKLYTKLSGNTAAADHFVDTLQRVAEIQNIDWENDGAVRIREVIKASAQAGEPLLQALIHPDVDSRALLSVVVAFGKQNQNVMDHLLLRRSQALAERTTINAALKLAMEDNRSAISEARAMVRRLPRLAVVADRLLTRLEKVKGEHQDLMDEIHRARTFIDFHQETMPLLREHLARLETVNGSSVAMFDAKNGAAYFVPRDPNAKFDLTWKKIPDPVSGAMVERLVSSTGEASRKELQLKADGHVPADLLAEMDKMEAWLKAQPADQHGSAWQYVNQQHEKLSWLDKGFEHQAKQQNIVTRLIGSITDKLRMVGHPATNEAARKIDQMQFWIASFAQGKDLARVSNRWEVKEGKLMKALGWKGGLETFRRLFYDRVRKHIEDRQDIVARNLDDETTVREQLASARAYMERDPDTAAFVQKPGAWAALEEFHRATNVAAKHEDNIRRQMGGKILDTGPGYDLYRESIGGPGTVRRQWSDLSYRVYRAMQPEWGGTRTPALDAASMAAAYQADPAALKLGLQSRFTPQVWKDFLKPLAFRAGRTLFNAPLRSDGYTPLALRERVIKAFEAAKPGDAVGFAEALFHTEHGTGDMAAFVGETLETLQKWFDVLHVEHRELAESNSKGVPMPRRALIDARRSEEAPAEWLEYRRYDGQSMKQTVKAMAFHAAGGRNLEAVYSNFDTALNELGNRASDYRQLLEDVKATGVSGKKLREGLKTEAARRGVNLKLLENASRNQAQVASMRRAFEGLAKSQLDMPMELRPFMELIHTMASFAVQGPGTALTDQASLSTQPFRHMGFSKEAFKDVLGNYKYLVKDYIGSLGWALNKQWNLDTEANNRRAALGLVDADPFLRVKEKLASLTHEPIQGLPEGQGRALPGRLAMGAARGAVLASRALRLIPSTGIGRAKTEGFAYPSLKPLGVFTDSALHQHGAVILQSWDRTAAMLGKMVEFYEAHPVEAADPAYKLTSKQAGYSERGFDYIKSSLARAGLDVEQQARKVVEARRTNPNAEIMSLDQYRNVAVQGVNEVMLESNFTTRPPSFLNNPWLAAATPLVGWGVSSLNDAAKSFAEPSGKSSWKGLKGGLLAYAAIVPLGLAYAWLRDEYDEKFQGKKANVQGFGANNNFLAALDKLGRAGVLFGTAGDAANAMFNQDTNRPFSVDSRVLFLSSMLNALNSVGTFFRQGSADYQSVYRPLMTALGANGYLQYADTLNHALSLDNQEARVTARISVGNYLRAAGRELQLDVRTGRGQASLPTPMKPYISQMVLAAYANDHQDFREAYRNAVQEAREMGKVDPQKSVADAFASYHPLKTVFRVEPTPDEYHKALRVMDEQGQQAVSAAVRLFNSYAEQLGIRPNEGRKVKATAGVQLAVPGLNELRSRAAAFGF